MYRPVAWSRHNIVAHGVCDTHGASVVLVSETGCGVRTDKPIVRLHPPPRAPAYGADATVLGAPSFVVFSPCGFTLAAYFPVRPATDAAGAPVPIAAPLESLVNVVPPSSAAASPTIPTTPPLPATPGSASDVELGINHTVPWDHGVFCLWTRRSHSSLDAWKLHHWLPVGPAFPAPAAPQQLHGDVVDVCWFGAPRLWHTTEKGFARAHARGPATFQTRPSYLLDQAQQEQVCLVFTSAAQVAFLHRLSERSPFRVHYGWLHVPGVHPPPAMLDVDSQRADVGLARVSHIACALVPDESCVLIAHAEAADAPVRLTEIHAIINGEMTCA